MSGAALGIDLGTSGVKCVLVDEAGEVIGQAEAALDVQRPQPLWSEQDPEDWWTATRACLASLAHEHAGSLARVRGIGLSGQMHGATLLDDRDRVLRPCILWNDGRSAAQCRELERRVPASREITGNLAMPGFTAPKLLWVREHEPECAARVARVLLPKDWLRLRLTGEYATDCSDASGTLWLDVARRRWSEAMLEATGLQPSAMPQLFEGTQPTGRLRTEWAREWGMDDGVVVVGGAGDQAAGAAGVGVVAAGQAFVSLGTSGVYFVAGDRFAPDPESALHAFCHCLPGRWHQMSVILSAASCLDWAARAMGAGTAEALLAEVEAREPEREPGAIFLPYLSGERTPHNDPAARGVFFGLDHETDRAELGRAVLEGVAFALADGQRVLRDAGARIDRVSVIGGGARSRFWGRILATVLERPLHYGVSGEVGPAYGVARLARIAVTGEAPDAVCTPPVTAALIEPEERWRGGLTSRYARYRQLYAALRDSWETA